MFKESSHLRGFSHIPFWPPFQEAQKEEVCHQGKQRRRHDGNFLLGGAKHPRGRRYRATHGPDKHRGGHHGYPNRD